MYVFKPANEIWVLIATGSSQDSDKPTHNVQSCNSLASHMHKSMKDEDSEKYLALAPHKR